MLKTGIKGLAATGLVSLSMGVSACGVSEQQEIQMGQQYAAEINRQLPIVDEPVVHRYLNQLGTEIQRQQGNRDIPYTFYVVNSEVINAFAVPGGFVYINRGLIERTDNLAELAGVVAHEIAHVEARHSAEMLEKQQSASIGVTLASVLLGQQPSGLAGAALDVGAAAYFSRHSREAELEADRIAVGLLSGVNIDPAGLITFFKELLVEQDRSPSQLEQWFSTHPLTEERIASIREIIRDHPVSTQRNLTVTTEAYRNFKHAVSRLPAPPPEFRDNR